MKLLLLETVEGLGRPGDQVDVKAGFACNYLLPQSKAVRVNSDTLRMLTRLKEKADAEERAMISSMQELADKINGFEVEVAARATEEGHLFGSVTEKDVHAALVAAGWNDLTIRQVRMMNGHIKEGGVEEVELHLYGEITAKVAVTVIPVDSEGLTIEVEEPEETEDDSEDADGEGRGHEAHGSAASSPEEADPATVDA
jgi:large subunit ribosomal protein L9